jgi:glutamate dehydrogenase (NAD(P)+)
VALGYCDFTIKDARLVIQGFGAVGQHTARFLTQKGARLIAAADSAGAIENKDGLDVNALIELKNNGHSVINYKQGKKLNKDEIIDVECDIWIPAARPDVIHEDNVHRLKTKLVIEGANIPLTHAAEKLLYEKGILYIPDFIANAGGVICAAMEYQHSSKQTAFETIEEKLRRNTQQILETCKQNFCLPREAAIEMALQRIKTAMGFHRWNLF